MAIDLDQLNESFNKEGYKLVPLEEEAAVAQEDYEERIRGASSVLHTLKTYPVSEKLKVLDLAKKMLKVKE